MVALIGIIGISFLLPSCAKKIMFNNSNIVPAAEGYVKIKTDKNKNYIIDLNVKNLAEPDRLSPPKKMYMVWMETDGNGVKALGQLKTSSSMISSALKSSLQSTTPYKPTAFFITAEDDVAAQYPSSFVVLRSSGY
jgi:hypothetical protein